MAVVMDEVALTAFLQTAFAQVADDFTVEEVGEMRARVRLNVAERHLRPGGTVSGPSMFALADVGIYVAILAMVGPEALAVTTSAHMDFMRKPAAGADLIAEVRLLKLGRVLVVGEVLMHSEGQEVPVARAAMTYSRPPSGGGAT
jgi:uncharacterized protein (TIGR00369 family)